MGLLVIKEKKNAPMLKGEIAQYFFPTHTGCHNGNMTGASVHQGRALASIICGNHFYIIITPPATNTS